MIKNLMKWIRGYDVNNYESVQGAYKKEMEHFEKLASIHRKGVEWEEDVLRAILAKMNKLSIILMRIDFDKYSREINNY